MLALSNFEHILILTFNWILGYGYFKKLEDHCLFKVVIWTDSIVSKEVNWYSKVYLLLYTKGCAEMAAKEGA